ncbi:sensor histidine kinase [Ectobacillus polymachus]|uniref:sensor histidine kinase n=1 Tax=Ectobacillus polymachus TaxID=1508806 RepID=UPI003A8682EE
MTRKSIVFKLFLLTFGFFTLTFVLFFVGQSLFLEKFYINKKVSGVTKAFETFVDDYSKSDQNFDTVKKLKQKFYDTTNAQLILLDQNGVIQDVHDYYIDVHDESNNTEYHIALNNILTGQEYSNFMKLALQNNESISVQGIRKKDTIIPISIISPHGTWTNGNIVSDLKSFGISSNDVNADPSSRNLLIQIKGTVTKMSLPSKADLQVANNIDTLIQGVQRWEISAILGEIDRNTLTTYTFSDEKGKNQMFVKPIVQNNTITEFAFAMTSFQPVNEAMIVLKDYYVYAMIIVFLVIILLSFYYSKIIAKPLIRVNRVTKRMANFDFSETLPVTSNDEIGSLSKSINTMSVTLKDRIEQLHVANEKLQEDVEKERMLERTRKDFISGVSHELKTPLSVIRSFAEGIKDGVSNNTDYYTDVILEEVDKMNTLIVDMLELAKLESGTYKLEVQTFSIDSLIHQVNTKLLFSMEEKNLFVTVNAEKDLVVEANRNRIEQVIINLLSNAIRYTPVGKMITISALDQGDRVYVSIKNDGEPIPEENLNKIWNRFYRLDASRSRNTGGTGLGLSIVKNILELHHAPYGVRNEEDGVLFYFSLKKGDKKE